MTSPILSAAADVLRTTLRPQSWYSQGGSSMQASQLISSLRALGATHASMADLLETDDVVGYLADLGGADKQSQPESFASNGAQAIYEPASRKDGDARQGRMAPEPLGSDDRMGFGTSQLWQRAPEGSDLTQNSAPTAHPRDEEMGPEALFLLRVARESGLRALVSMMDACVQMRGEGKR